MRSVDADDLITQTEAGELRGVTRPAIHSLVVRGRLRSIKIGGTIYVFRSEVLRLKTNRTIRSDEEILRDVRRVARMLRHKPTSTEYKEHGKIHLSSVCKRFGNWSKVLAKL